MPQGASWVRIAGDGQAYQGRCVFLGLLWRCDKNDHECKVYDGLDPSSGRPFCEVIGVGDTFQAFGLGKGVEFSNGIYLDQTTSEDVATVYFEPLEL